MGVGKLHLKLLSDGSNLPIKKFLVEKYNVY